MGTPIFGQFCPFLFATPSGWMGGGCAQPFSDLFIDVPTDVPACLSCWRMNWGQQRSWAVFIQDISVHLRHPSFPLSLLVTSCLKKPPQSVILPPLCLTVGTVLAWWCTFPPNTLARIHTKEFNLCLIRPETFFVLQAKWPLGTFWQTPDQASVCLLLRSGFCLTSHASVPFARFVPTLSRKSKPLFDITLGLCSVMHCQLWDLI